MDMDKIMELIEKVDNSGISSLTVEEGCLKISIEKNKGQVIATEGTIPVMLNNGAAVGAYAQGTGMSVQSSTGVPVQGGAAGMPVLNGAGTSMQVGSAGIAQSSTGVPMQGGAVAPAQSGDAAAAPDVFITSPIVGVFYTASGPDEPPFAKVGDTVKKGQVVGIVEAMKLMNEIESDVDGVIGEILVENAQGVEYGQPLFKIK